MPKQLTYDTPQPVGIAVGTKPRSIRVDFSASPPVANAVMVQFDESGDPIAGGESSLEFIPSDALLDMLGDECCGRVISKAAEDGKAVTGTVEATPAKEDAQPLGVVEPATG